MTKRTLKSLLIAILIPELIGSLSAILSSTATKEQFAILIKPPLAPPAATFPIIWPILYLLMGIASWLVWRHLRSNHTYRNAPGNLHPLRLYAAQLAVNALWPLIFFNLHLRLFAACWLVLLLILIRLTMHSFAYHDKKAALLLLPYFLWSCFALYLNIGYWLLN